LFDKIPHYEPLEHFRTPGTLLVQALVSVETVEVPLMDRWRLPYPCTILAQRREASSWYRRRR
jgi:hypothetical protein